MSFILDALKKSEHARQRQAGPALFEVKVVQPRRTVPLWAVVIILLVLINVITLGWIVLSHGQGKRPTRPPSAAPAAVIPRSASPTPAPALRPAAVAAVSAASASAPPPSATPVPPGGSGAGGFAAAAPAAQSAATIRSLSTANPPSPADLEPALQPAANAPPRGAAKSSGSLPLYAQIAAEPGSSLPRLHLDLHVYSPLPRKRFVMINMHKLHQGDALADGVSVVKIRPDGVVLSYHGRQFLLPR
jgi:general secretion pathway protein B